MAGQHPPIAQCTASDDCAPRERFARAGGSAFRLRSRPAARAAGRARDGFAQSARKGGARGLAPGAGCRAWQHQPPRTQARHRPQHPLPENATAAHQVSNGAKKGAVVTVRSAGRRVRGPPRAAFQKKRMAPKAMTLSLLSAPDWLSALVLMYSPTRFRLWVRL